MVEAISIIYEDDDIAVVHKPSGIASQATKDEKGSLIESLNANWQPVHRLDQRVSGIILFAKNDKTFAVLSSAFAYRQVKKYYRAVVANKPTIEENTLTHWLLKDGKNNKAKAFNKEVAHSQTAALHYRLLLSSLKYHLLDVELFTGRFHQIRAQLAAIGSPIVGDVKYGYKRTTPDGSIFLQSYSIAFAHPNTKEAIHFEIEMPELWKKYGL